MSIEQLEKVTAMMRERFSCAPWIAALGGLRIGEVAGLQRQDIDLDKRVLHVRRSLKFVAGGTMLGNTKTASSARVVPITDLLAVELEQHLKKFVAAEKEAPLFLTSTGGRNVIGTIRNDYNRACRANGLEGYNFHKLRATCATQLARAGATPKEIMKWLGHSSWNVSLMYQLAPFERLEEVSSRLNNTLLIEN